MNPFTQLIGLSLLVHVLIILIHMTTRCLRALRVRISRKNSL